MNERQTDRQTDNGQTDYRQTDRQTKWIDGWIRCLSY